MQLANRRGVALAAIVPMVLVSAQSAKTFSESLEQTHPRGTSRQKELTVRQRRRERLDSHPPPQFFRTRHPNSDAVGGFVDKRGDDAVVSGYQKETWSPLDPRDEKVLWWVHTPKTAGVSWTRWVDFHTEFPTCGPVDPKPMNLTRTVPWIEANSGVLDLVAHMSRGCRLFASEARLTQVKSILGDETNLPRPWGPGLSALESVSALNSQLAFGAMVREPISHVVSSLMWAIERKRLYSITEGIKLFRRGKTRNPSEMSPGDNLVPLHSLRHPQSSQLAPTVHGFGSPGKIGKVLESLEFVGIQELFVESKYLVRELASQDSVVELPTRGTWGVKSWV